MTDSEIIMIVYTGYSTKGKTSLNTYLKALTEQRLRGLKSSVVFPNLFKDK